MQEEKIYLDEEGYQEYKKSIDNLLVNLGRIEERINIVKENDDSLTDYEELLSMKENIKERIKIKRDSLTKIVIVKNDNIDDNVLKIGDVVRINTYYEDGVEEEICELVSTESTIEGIIEKTNINCPKGKALYGSSIGETKHFEIKKEKIKIDIIEKINKKELKKVL